jgi:Matrixin
MRPDGCAGRFRRPLFALAALLALAGVSRDAAAFCRTTTCGLPPNFAPSDGECTPPDFASRCASLDPPAKVLPIYWSNACVSYDIQKDASVQVPYDTAAQLFATAFAKWTGTTCATGGRVSIDTKDLGPVACDQVQYSSDQGNQHVIIFHDDTWPHEGDANTTLALTTMTFDPDTGEIFDADMEINSTSAIPLSLSQTVPPNGYDFQSIITHETGHFLGMAHSSDTDATMFARYMPGSQTMRDLAADDTAGICSVYLPDGARAVDPSVASSGTVEEASCDPTPRHGFQSICAQPVHHGCALSSAPGSRAAPGSTALAVAALALAARARRRATAARM